MGAIAAIADARGTRHHRRARTVIGLLALAALAAGLIALLTQVEVTHGATATSRSCGSAFDTIVDRTGWESWWASDLDEPDDAVRTALVRTEGCPGAVNGRIVAATALGGLAVVLTALLRRPAADDGRTSGGDRTPAGRVVRIGTVTTWLAGILTLAGFVAVVVLVADADSTLFLYTDRVVVGIVGLIVLIPTFALFVIGRVLTVIGTHVEQLDPEHSDA